MPVAEGGSTRSGRSSAVPSSVASAVRLTWVMVAMAGLTALVSWLRRDDLVLAWAAGNRQARELVREGGLRALEQSSMSIPAFVPLAFSSFAVLAGLALVLVAFFRTGHNWARVSLAALVLFAAFSTMISVLRGLPPAFLVLALVTCGVYVALLWFLFHRDTNAYLRH